ncbi:MAG: hypothetical protein LAT82_00915 [Nanoarchaeota archaeon]|nr:hypothetical protein [Nanoarchaeota archaeon]
MTNLNFDNFGFILNNKEVLEFFNNNMKTLSREFSKKDINNYYKIFSKLIKKNIILRINSTNKYLLSSQYHLFLSNNYNLNKVKEIYENKIEENKKYNNKICEKDRIKNKNLSKKVSNSLSDSKIKPFFEKFTHITDETLNQFLIENILYTNNKNKIKKEILIIIYQLNFEYFTKKIIYKCHKKIFSVNIKKDNFDKIFQELKYGCKDHEILIKSLNMNNRYKIFTVTEASKKIKNINLF